MKMTTYYKITNKNETHYGFEYQDGFIILKEKFNNDENASCVSGGFYRYGIYLREVELPCPTRDEHLSWRQGFGKAKPCPCGQVRLDASHPSLTN